MSEIKTLTEAPAQVTGKKHLMIGIIPNRNDFFVGAAWSAIKDMAQEIIDKVQGEYTLMNLWQEIYYGNAHLFMAYELPWDKEGEPDEEGMQAAVINHLADKKAKEDFIGYAVMRTNVGNSAFIWHAAVTPKYQNTTAVDDSFEWLIKWAMKIGAPFVDCSTYDKAMERLLERRGFKKGYTVHRLELPKKERKV